MRNRVAIVGSHPETRNQAPWDDLSFDIWVFNEAPGLEQIDGDGRAVRFVKRCDAVFQMHSPAIYRNPENRSDKDHWAWLQEQHDCTIWMQEDDPAVPACEVYPLEEIRREYLGRLGQDWDEYRGGFFTSTPAYAIALAIYMRYDEIHLYGMEMASGTEYQLQRDCVAFLIGMALGACRVVELHCLEGVFNRLLYGYASDIEQHLESYEARDHELKGLLRDARRKHQAAESGFVQACDDFAPAQRIADRLGEGLDAALELGQLEGQLEVNNGYRWKIQAMIAESNRAVIDRNEFEVGIARGATEAQGHNDNVYRTAGTIDYVFRGYDLTRNPLALEQIREFSRVHVQAGYEKGKAMGRSAENQERFKELVAAEAAAGGVKAKELLTTNNPLLVGEPLREPEAGMVEV